MTRRRTGWRLSRGLGVVSPASIGCAAAVVLALLFLAPAGAAAAKNRISGKLSKPGYEVIALAANGKASSVRARPRFKLRPPAKRVSLHLRAPDGTYAGPVVVTSQRRGKRAILGIKAGAKFGQVVKVKRRHGYGKAKLRKTWRDPRLWGRARRGVPRGNGTNFGRVRSKAKRGTPGDLDKDGVPDVLDIDNDGDLILNPVDSSPTQRAALSSAAANPNDFGIHPILPLLWEHSASSNAGSSDAEIEDDLPTLGRIGIDVLGPGAELDCGGEPDPEDPAGWSEGLSYCTRGGSGTSYEGDDVFGGPPFPGSPGGTYDPDGDGFGTLDAVSPWQLHHGARPRHSALDPSVSQIGGGDVLVQRVTSGGEEGPCESAHTSCFASTVPFVFATAQTLESWGDRPGESNPLAYPIPPGGEPFAVSDDPADADSDVEVRLTFWRPQRRPIAEDECASPRPGCTGDEWIDIGGLRYRGAILDLPQGGLGGRCPASAYTVPTGEELVPSPVDGDPLAGGLIDQATDSAADPLNTFTYELNLTKCLDGTAWTSGEDIGVGFAAETTSTGYTELSGVRFKLE